MERVRERGNAPKRGQHSMIYLFHQMVPRSQIPRSTSHFSQRGTAPNPRTVKHPVPWTRSPKDSKPRAPNGGLLP